jgi:hypothetical protein
MTQPHVRRGVAEGNLTIAHFDVLTGKWVECECEVDVQNHLVISHVSHFTLFAIFAEVHLVSPLTPALKHINWPLIMGIVAAVLVASMAAIIIVRRRHSAAK